MPLALHKVCTAKLVETLTNGLQNLRVKNGILLDDLSTAVAVFFAERALPATGRIREQMIEYVDHYPLMNFVKDQLSVKLQETQEYISEPDSIELAKLNGFEDSKLLAKYLVDEFCSLPVRHQSI